MKIHVHYPTSEEGCAELSRRVAEIHADTVTRYIDKLSCSTEQKLALIDALQKNCEENERESSE